MCDNCRHKPVCSIYRATGGVKKCEHFKEERKGKWEQIGYDKAMDRITCTNCLEYFNIVDNCTEAFKYCPNCGADMRGTEDGN